MFKAPRSTCIAAAAALLAGCTTTQTHVAELRTRASQNIEAETARAERNVPVITSTSAAWLLGEAVEVAPAPSPLLDQMVTYSPAQRVSLVDVATWITQQVGVVVDTVEVQAAAPSAAAPLPPSSMTATLQASAAANAPPPLPRMKISYEGKLRGLLDVAANESGVWHKMEGGRIVFFRSETRTIYLPALPRSSTSTNTISAETSGGGEGGGSGGGAPASGGAPGGGGSDSGGGGGSGGSGGAKIASTYNVDVWADLEKTAKNIGGSAKVIVNRSMSSLTVTGTPAQVRAVESWAKGVAANLSQQVAITVQVFKVRTTSEDSLNWNPNVVFKGLTTKYGFTLSGPQVPASASGDTPFNFTGSVLETATGSKAQYTGSQLAVQALSKLGDVSEIMKQTLVTKNGQVLPLQVATQTSYLASSTQAATVAGNAPTPPSLTPGVTTNGYTAMFLPHIVNGKIDLAMHMTNSALVRMGSVTSGGSSIQTPNIDMTKFEQSVSLTPGDSLLLTGYQAESGSTDKSGVGVANNYLLGGGVGSNRGKQLIAIVISAKVL
jgi:type IVB pilus formation R64 PilN family outer membrane protein